MGIFSFLKGKKHKNSLSSASSDLTNALINAVIKASFACAESMKPEIEQNSVSEIERKERFGTVYFEFFYFFMHHINRLLFGNVNQSFFDRYLKMGWMYCAAAVLYAGRQSIIACSSDEAEIKLSKEVLDKLDEREGQYANSQQLCWDKDKPLDGILGDSVLAKITRNIAMQCGYEMVDYNGVMVASNMVDNMILQVKVSELFINITRNLNFESLVIALIREAR
jgi:hypothetical protein